MSKPKIIVVYQPHQNIRQHFPKIQAGYLHCFDYAHKVYWLPTFLSRENDLPILTPCEILEKSGIWDNNLQKANNNNRNNQNFNSKPINLNSPKSKMNAKQNHQLEKFEISELDQNLAKKLEIHKKNNDLIIFMGAGDIDNWAKKWAKR